MFITFRINSRFMGVIRGYQGLAGCEMFFFHGKMRGGLPFKRWHLADSKIKRWHLADSKIVKTRKNLGHVKFRARKNLGNVKK